MIAIARWAITVTLILANVITCKGFDFEGIDQRPRACGIGIRCFEIDVVLHWSIDMFSSGLALSINEMDIYICRVISPDQQLGCWPDWPNSIEMKVPE